MSGYYTPEKEAVRKDVNAWIRGNKTADALIDFDKVLADPENPEHINPVYDCGDHLHPNDAGYQAMAKAVNLTLLVPMKSSSTVGLYPPSFQRRTVRTASAKARGAS